MEPTKDNEELNVSESTEMEATEVKTEQSAEAKEAVQVTEESKAAETAGEPETTEPEKTPEEIAAAKAEKSKKIKFGVIGAGGAFILLAIVYLAAVAGGKNATIEKEEPTVAEVEVEEEEEEDEVVVAVPTVEVEDEEDTPEDSMIGVVFGNARYDDCLYADGGVIVVTKDSKYGAINYEGKEIVPLKYDVLEEMPTKEGMFVLSSVNAGETKYTLFDKQGKALYEGANMVVASNNTYMLYIEDASGGGESRVEYHKIGTKDKPYMTIYVNDQFSLNGFMDGKTTVMGFTAVPTEDQKSNPTNLFCGVMDETGKVEWFAKAPGMDEFDKEMKAWEDEQKALEKTKAKNKKSTKKKAKKSDEQLVDEDGNPIENLDESDEELDELADDELDEDKEELDEESEELDENGEKIEKKSKKKADSDEVDEESEDEELEADEDTETDLDDEDSDKPEFLMREILSAPVGGYFIYKDKYDVKDSYSWYTDKGLWYADLDTAFLEKDDKKGFKVGNFNDGEVQPKPYLLDGEYYYNFGSLMVLTVGEKDVLIDMSKGKGMTAESVSNKIVLATYDEIIMDDNDFWMYKDGDTYGYIDQKGKAQKLTFEGATPFVNGYALVIKNKQAIIINEKFEEVEILDDATEVSVSGDIMNITDANGLRRYMIKDIRDNGGEVKAVSDPKATPDPKSTPGATATPVATSTPEASSKKKK